MKLAPIIHSTEMVGAPYAPSLNAAFVALHTTFGIWPEVRAPLGGARTKAECDSLGTSWRMSDHWEGRGRAADIWNHTAFRTTRAREAVYYAILAHHGWRNITTAGNGFPAEPWHVANHNLIPAGTGGVPLPGVTPTSTEGPTMSQAIYTKFEKPPLDSEVAKLRSYLGGNRLSNFSAGVGVYALVGDSPGTRANVQVSQLDSRGNEWAADHAGDYRDSAGTLVVDKAVRKYPLDEFLALCDAYLQPLAAGSSVAGTVELGAASIGALAAEIDRYADGRKQAS